MATPVNFYAQGALLTLLDGEVGFMVAANEQWQPANSSVVQWLALKNETSEMAQATLGHEPRNEMIYREIVDKDSVREVTVFLNKP